MSLKNLSRGVLTGKRLVQVGCKTFVFEKHLRKTRQNTTIREDGTVNARTRLITKYIFYREYYNERIQKYRTRVDFESIRDEIYKYFASVKSKWAEQLDLFEGYDEIRITIFFCIHDSSTRVPHLRLDCCCYIYQNPTHELSVLHVTEDTLSSTTTLTYNLDFNICECDNTLYIAAEKPVCIKEIDDFRLAYRSFLLPDYIHETMIQQISQRVDSTPHQEAPFLRFTERKTVIEYNLPASRSFYVKKIETESTREQKLYFVGHALTSLSLGQLLNLDTETHLNLQYLNIALSAAQIWYWNEPGSAGCLCESFHRVLYKTNRLPNLQVLKIGVNPYGPIRSVMDPERFITGSDDDDICGPRLSSYYYPADDMKLSRYTIRNMRNIFNSRPVLILFHVTDMHFTSSMRSALFWNKALWLVVMTFMRANRDNSLKTSIFDLLPILSTNLMLPGEFLYDAVLCPPSRSLTEPRSIYSKWSSEFSRGLFTVKSHEMTFTSFPDSPFFCSPDMWKYYMISLVNKTEKALGKRSYEEQQGLMGYLEYVEPKEGQKKGEKTGKRKKRSRSLSASSSSYESNKEKKDMSG